MQVDIDALKVKLREKYYFDCDIFLEDIEGSPSSFLYKKLEPWYRKAYEDSYRFIFFNFEPLQKETLDHIVSTLYYIDISPYFVLVVSNQDSTIEYFQSLPEKIHAVKVNGHLDRKVSAQVKPLFNLDKKMCAHAWTGLHVDPSGTARLCCYYKDTIKKDNGENFNIRETPIKEILNSKYIASVRNIFRQGQTPSECQACETVEKSNGTSKRMLTPFKLKNLYGAINWESDSVDDQFGWIGGHLGNLCNLKCRICSEKYSSSIAIEKLNLSSYENKKQDPVYHTLVNHSWTKTGHSFWEQLKTLVPPIKNFEFLGGEPLLVQENLDFMQWLIDQNYSKDCIFEFVTNGTVYPEIFDRANEFARLTITLSIDNIEDRFELERSGASWTTLENNLEKFVNSKNKNSSMEIGVSITVNIQNVLYLPELVRWLRSKNVSHYSYNWLESPSWLNVNRLTPDAKNLVLDKLTQADLEIQDLENLKPVIARVSRATTSDGKEFCENVRQLDQLRKQNFSITHKEIATAMGYVLK